MFRLLGNREVPAVGLGCMGMSEFYGAADEATSLQTLNEAFNLGYRHFDTADMYGFGHNETLVGKFINQENINREELFISTKGGIVRDVNDKYNVSVNSTEQYIRAACEASLKRLNTEYIDLYYLHRLDPAIELEESIGTLKALVKEGKIKNIGLCEVSEDQLAKAHQIHPVAAVQSELSLWSRDSEQGVLPLCVELGVAFVAFSPLGRGFLSGSIDKSFMAGVSDDLDFRKRLPRFSEDNIDSNMRLVEKLKGVAERLQAPVSQVALAWVLAKAPNVHIIPGSKTPKYLQNNFDSRLLSLEPSVVEELNTIFSPDAVVGSRYPQKILEKSSA